MTAIASASPVAIHSYAPGPYHNSRPASVRPIMHRRQSPIPKGSQKKFLTPSDSSDDEDIAPIKLSAEAQAILGEEQSHATFDKENDAPHFKNSDPAASRSSESANHRASAPREGSPGLRRQRPEPPSILERDGSFAYKVPNKSKSFTIHDNDSRTPMPRLRRIRVSGSRSQTKSPSSSSTATRRMNQSEMEDDRSPDEGENKSYPEIEDEQNDPHTIAQPRRVKENGIHSTLRANKMGTGTLLRGHVRRGLLRRQDDENDVNSPYIESESYSPEAQQGRKAEPELADQPDDLLINYDSPQPKKRQSPPQSMMDNVNQEQAVPVQQMLVKSASPPKQAIFSASIRRQFPIPAVANLPVASPRSSSSRRPQFNIPSLPPMGSIVNQENEPPPTFKRPRAVPSQLELHRENADEKDNKATNPSVLQDSPSRPPLAARSNNTPRRAAPAPPPKMSLVEAATSNAGNSRAKKSVHYVLNGRTYRRLDLIGKGGSSRVFRIMAENYKIFALKRVNLEEADMAAIAGYKGEIQLLKKLENVERVVRLFDYEVNEDKGILSVMMELGETDFYKMLESQLKSENSKFDITFTRHYWKEMLECVQSVHEHGIVHSDLKPANFLLVKGQLKLIDFGIANAIQDNTVNVHRENQIGTPNYMSPESLVCRAPIAGQAAGTKILKLGRPSDVWSLGCILYQMTYGQPPFAHIKDTIEKIMSIPNPKIEIQYPVTGIGGSVVPFGLIKTLKRCLTRDQALRPTIKELLSDADPFLNPVAISPDMLSRVVSNVVNHCRKREEENRSLPREDEMRGWGLAFYEKLKQAQEEGTAW